MANTQSLKKDFQKAVKAYRDTLPNVVYTMGSGEHRERRPEYPKAMLTARQAEKHTATVSFGDWANGSEKLAQRIADFKKFGPFVDLCNRYGIALGGVEQDSWGYASLRLHY